MKLEDINRKIAKIDGKCWCEPIIPAYSETCSKCKHCGEVWSWLFQGADNPDYCTDLNLVREVEMKLKEEWGNLFFLYLINLRKTKQPEVADAHTRCLAIIKTWEEKC